MPKATMTENAGGSRGGKSVRPSKNLFRHKDVKLRCIYLLPSVLQQAPMLTGPGRPRKKGSHSCATLV